MNITSVEGEGVDSGEEIYPCFAGLPMGFSWALHFAQTANTEVTDRAEHSSPAPSPILDGEPFPSLANGENAAPIYVDNVNVVGTDESG